MKRLFIFAMMTLAASSSFAIFSISDKLKCSNGRVYTETYNHIDESDLRLMVQYTVDGVGTFRALVTSESSGWGSERSFVGRASDGTRVKLLVKKENGLKATLKIDGMPAERGLSCSEQTPFNNI